MKPPDPDQQENVGSDGPRGPVSGIVGRFQPHAFAAALLLFVLPAGEITLYGRYFDALAGGIFLGTFLSIWALTLVVRKVRPQLQWGALLVGLQAGVLCLSTFLGSGYYADFHLAKYALFFATLFWMGQAVNGREIHFWLRAFPLTVLALGVVWAGGVAGLLSFGVASFSRPLELTFGNPNMLGLFAVLNLALVPACFASETSRRWKVACVGAFVLALAMVVWTGSRNALLVGSGVGLASVVITGAFRYSARPVRILAPLAWAMAVFVFVFAVFFGLRMLGTRQGGFVEIVPLVVVSSCLLLALLIFLVVRFGRSRIRFIGLLAGYGLVLGLLCWFAGLGSRADQEDFARLTRGDVDVGRDFLYRATVSIITESPRSFLLGEGPGAYYSRALDRDPADFGLTDIRRPSFHVHQEFLESWLTGGLVGLVLQLGLAGLTAFLALRAALGQGSSREAGAALACLSLAILAFYLFGMFSLANRSVFNEFTYFAAIGLVWPLCAPRSGWRLPPASALLLLPLLVLSSVPLVRAFVSDVHLARAIHRLHDKEPGFTVADSDKLLERAVAWYPGNLRARIELFRHATHPAVNDLAAARHHFLGIQEIVPGFNRSPLQFARMLFIHGHPDEAIRMLAEFTENNRFDFAGHLHLVSILFLAGPPGEFQEHLARFLRAAVDASALENDQSVPSELREVSPGEWEFHFAPPPVDGEPTPIAIEIGSFASYVLGRHERIIRSFPEPEQRLGLTLGRLAEGTVNLFRLQLGMAPPTGLKANPPGR